jgi:hypothetical protein
VAAKLRDSPAAVSIDRTQGAGDVRAAWASGLLAPGRAYSTTAEAVKLKHGRIVGHGTAVSEPVTMPSATDYWRPISGLPGGPPPSS